MGFFAIAALVVGIFVNLRPFVSSKGCFLGTVEITLADGKRKQLRDVQVGDILASFDEVTGRPSVSTVMDVPKFRRERSDLVEIALPNARIHATHDHPFWSRARRGLVSAHPNKTMDEYSLMAHEINDDEELEDEQQQGIGISGILRAPARSLAASSLRGSADEVDVMTLCMHPHHWYYVHGVRVHNKGCFVPSTPVSMADGTKKELKSVTIGDMVSSWDDALGRPVNSTVMAVPTFQRRASEMMEVSLPSGTIRVTHDHPFWSKGRQTLVSLHPNQTQEEYGLEARMMTVGEALQEIDAEQHVPVVGLRRLVDGGMPDGEQLVDVMTLCLQPYHWYHVNGVRVHNKGCFAPWTPVLMSDYTEKPISEVKEQDKVISWDESTGQTSVATVLGIAQFPAGDLLQVNLNITPGQSEHSMARQLLHAGATPWPADAPQLIMTHDHPIYSARAGSVVSMDPKQSSQLYGLAVEQMHEHESLRHHLGHDIYAQVQNWNGSADYVLTLRLDRHHWFHVHGVRVHNKGGGGGGSGGGGGGGGFTRSVTVRSSASSYRGSWLGLVLLSGGSRRRYGDYRQQSDSKCTMASSAETTQICSNTMCGFSGPATCSSPPGSVPQQPCHDCLACTSESCMQFMSGCESFTRQAFKECEHEEEESNMALIVIVIVVAVLIMIGSFALCAYSSHKSSNPAVKARRETREAMQMSNEVNLGPQTMFNGTYSENGETKPTTYRFTITPEGQVSGISQDDDGQAQCDGKLFWPADASSGEIAWLETRPGVNIEAAGTIQPNGSELVLRANYDSSYQKTQGSVQLSCPNAGIQVPIQGVVVTGQVVGAANKL